MSIMKIFDIRERSESIAWSRIFENPHRLATSLNRMLLVVLGKYTKGWSITAYTVAKVIYRLYKAHGMAFCSTYLKSNHMALLHYLSWDQSGGPRSPVKLDTRCKLTKTGLPRLILPAHRSIIRSGGKSASEVIRCYLTLFGLYRVYFRKSGRADFKSIYQTGLTRYLDRESLIATEPSVTPGMDELVGDLLWFLTKSFPILARKTIRGFPTDILFGFDWKPAWTSGPNANQTGWRTSVRAFRHDLNHWLYSFVTPVSEEEDQSRNLLLDILCTHLFPSNYFSGMFPAHYVEPNTRFTDLLSQLGKPVLGRWGILGKKIEGGGKIRVFAMLDSIRQAFLRPIHKWFMRALRSIPNDGTFDQLKPLTILSKRGEKSLFSYDLKSATDRFPIFLQTAVLEGFLGLSVRVAWDALLRYPYHVPFVKKRNMTVRFATGQPLGAYSSWPVFALTHHAFVQYCAQKAGLSKDAWFKEYCILGDDIVLSNPRVAQVYRELLDYMGVSISYHKSVISNNRSCEFAKRFLWKGIDVSPVSFKEVYVIRRSTCQSLVKRLRAFREVSRLEAFRWFGAGYKVRPNYLRPLSGRWKRFGLLLTSPGGPFPLPLYWWMSLYASRPVTPADTSIVHVELLEKWDFSFNPEGIPTETEADLVEEILVGRSWISSWLSTNTPFLLSLLGEDPIVSWFHRPTVPSTPERPIVNRSFRLGKMYWIYDRVMSILKKPTRKLLSS